jgi:hypothetical protein
VEGPDEEGMKDKSRKKKESNQQRKSKVCGIDDCLWWSSRY